MQSANTLVRCVNEYAFASIVQARPYHIFGRPVHQRDGSHRLQPGISPQTLQIPSHNGHPVLQCSYNTGQQGITPAFGYSTPHLSAEGTLTLMINALPSAHYAPIRLLYIPFGFLGFILVGQYSRVTLFYRSKS